jgi:hypothetical protein
MKHEDHTPNTRLQLRKQMNDISKLQETAAGGCPPATCSPVFSVDYGLIRKVMESIEHLGDDSDSDCACRRVYRRMLAEATGMPLAGHRLLMEKEVHPKYRKDYSLAPNFQEND